MSRPAISVMMPCFNSQDTLPFALASLAAQTRTDWECVCVDDGSNDRTWEILNTHAARDPRFRLERFETNRGRGAARQRILELIRGDYLAFLDSDDWMYPDRLAHEARWLDTDPMIAAVSVCAAVTNGSEELVGLMRPRAPHPLPVVTLFDEPVPPPILFPTSMIRANLAQRTGFDPAFRRSQDSDFLMRALLGKHYALSSQVFYAYSQASAASLERTLDGYRYRMRAHMRHVRAYPIRVTKTLVETAAKMLTFRAAGAIGAERALISRRWGAVDEVTKQGFAQALNIVRATARELFA